MHEMRKFVAVLATVAGIGGCQPGADNYQYLAIAYSAVPNADPAKNIPEGTENIRISVKTGEAYFGYANPSVLTKILDLTPIPAGHYAVSFVNNPLTASFWLRRYDRDTGHVWYVDWSTNQGIWKPVEEKSG